VRGVHRPGGGAIPRGTAGERNHLINRSTGLWLAAALGVVALVAVLWAAPRLQPAEGGTLVVIVAGRTATTLPDSALALGRGGDWSAVGNVSGSVPAAPDQRQVLTASLPAGRYDGVQLGADSSRVTVTITAGQVEPVLIGIDGGRLLPGAVYAGNDDINLGLGELAGKFVPMPAFQLTDQWGHALTLDTVAGKDVIIAAFHTTCHETCPLYTALFLQLAKQTHGSVALVEATTDPATDTPAALTAYAKQIGASWTFATGTTEEMSSFWKPFGVELASGDTHTSTLALVDRHGYIRLVYRGVPKVGNDIPPSLVTSLSAAGLSELAAGGDGWGAPDVLQALSTIRQGEAAPQNGGGRAPVFRLTSSEGITVQLSDLLGRPFVLNFWATYCPPCKAEMPMLDRDLKAYPSVRLVLVDEGETPDAARAFLTSLGLSRPTLLDTDLGVGRSYGLSALPMTVFVRSDGTIDRRQVGQLDEGVLASELSILSGQ
jgi:cytochrome oxidase Cu insertion factor (SCO1/SenC/PrrC family)